MNDSSSSDEEDYKGFRRMDALVPDPSQIIKDTMNNEAIDSVVPSGQKVNSDL